MSDFPTLNEKLNPVADGKFAGREPMDTEKDDGCCNTDDTAGTGK